MSKERECLLWVDAFLLGQKAIGADGIAEIRRRVGNALRDEKWPPAWTEPASGEVAEKDLGEAIRAEMDRRRRESAKKSWPTVDFDADGGVIVRELVSATFGGGVTRTYKKCAAGNTFTTDGPFGPEEEPPKTILGFPVVVDKNMPSNSIGIGKTTHVFSWPSDNYGPRDYGP